jgi:hypothetical protein
VQELLHQRGDALATLLQALHAMTGAEQRLLEAAVGDLHAHRPLHEAHEARPRVGIGQRALRERGHGGDAIGEQRLDQLVLVAEAAVGGADADARVARDLVEPDVEALLREQRPGGLEQPLPVALRVGAQRAGVG